MRIDYFSGCTNSPGAISFEPGSSIHRKYDERSGFGVGGKECGDKDAAIRDREDEEGKTLFKSVNNFSEGQYGSKSSVRG
jgi:hypothetical protein